MRETGVCAAVFAARNGVVRGEAAHALRGERAGVRGAAGTEEAPACFAVVVATAAASFETGVGFAVVAATSVAAASIAAASAISVAVAGVAAFDIAS